MRRAWLRVLAGVGVVLVLLAGVLLWLAMTSSGLEFVWQRVRGRLPARVQAAEIDGRLFGPLIAKGLVIDTDTLHVEIERAELDWHPLDLIDRRFEVERIALDGVGVKPRPGPSAQPAGGAKPFVLPASLPLPVAVDVRQVAVTRLEYFAEQDAAPVSVERVELGLRLDSSRWLIHDLDVRAPLFGATGRAAFVPRGDYAVDAEVDWTLHPSGYPDASGKTTVTGDLERLVVQQSVQPPYAVDARLVVMQPLGAGRLDGEIKAALEPEALGLGVPVTAIDANASVGGSLEAVDVDGRARLESPELANLELRLDATYTSELVRIRTLHLQEPDSRGELELEGRVALAPKTEVDLGGSWQDLKWPPAGTPMVASPSGTLQLSGTPQTLKADLSAEVDGMGGVQGTVRREGGRLNASLAWHDLAWPASSPEAHSQSGQLTVAGTLDDYRLTLDTDLALEAGPSGHLRAEGTGNLEGLKLERIDADVLRGKLTGRADAQWSPNVAASADLTASGLDPGVLSRTWPGRLDGRLTASGALEKQGARLELTTLKLDGKLRGRAIAVDGSGAYAAKALRIDELSVKSGSTELRADGTLSDTANLRLSLSSPNLADLWPSFAGRLTAHGRIEGPRAMPLVVLDASGSGIQVPEAAVGDLSLSADVDAAGKSQSNLALSVENAELAGTAVKALRLNASGNAAAHELTLAAETEVGTARLALNGSVDRPWQSDFVWRFGVTQATVAYPQLAAWTLQGTAAGQITASAANLDRSCWRSGGAELCLDAGGGRQGTRGDLTLTGLPFAYFEPLAPEPVSVSGQLSATAALQLPAGQAPRIDVKFNTTPGHIGPVAASPAAGEAAPAAAGEAAQVATSEAAQAAAGGAAQAAGAAPQAAAQQGGAASGAGARIPGLTFGAATGHIVSDAERATIDLEWPFEDQGMFDLNAVVDRVPGEPLTASTIDGDADVAVNDLSFLAEVVDQVDNTAGTLTGKLALSGTLASPRLVGRVALEDVRADLVAPGITVEHFNLSLTGDGSGALDVAARAESGGGAVSGKGTLRLAGAVPVGHIDLSGQNFELYDTADARVFVSPQLAVDATSRRIDLTGRVMVPKAAFTPRAVPQGAVTVSPDQVIVDEQGEAAPRELSRPLYAKIQLELGDQVTFDGLGLTGKLAGGVQIVEAPKQPTTGTGELRVEKGTYEAYGQKLDIRRGRLTFAGGPLTRPGLDVEAVRQATQDILVGARVQGTLAQPQLSLFSEPPLPQQEQLSYLVLGRSLDKASSSETSALSSAAIALGLKGGNFVSQKLNKSLGFQEFGIETQPGEGGKSASFVIGRYLSPSLYVSYGVGLFQPVNTLKLRYTISSHWRLVTESSAQGKGGDLLYHVERGE